MKRSFKLLVLTPLLFSVVAAAGGVRNGGTGIDCDGEVELLDLRLARDSGMPVTALSETAIVHSVRERLAGEPDLRNAILKRLKFIGPVVDWDLATGEQGKLDEVTASRDAMLARKLPAKCHLIQISFFRADQSPEREWNNYIRLPKTRLPALRLHEAIFGVGVTRFHHKNAVLTQHLTAAILADSISAGEISSIVSNFKNWDRPLRNEASGIFINQPPRILCARSVLALRTGGYGSQISYFQGERLYTFRYGFHPSRPALTADSLAIELKAADEELPSETCHYAKVFPATGSGATESTDFYLRELFDVVHASVNEPHSSLSAGDRL